MGQTLTLKQQATRNSARPAEAQPPKAVVCHAGSRDHYELAGALADAGLLEKLVTDVYVPAGTIPFSSALLRAMPKLSARSNPLLPPNRVATPTALMLNSLAMRTPLASRSRQISLDNGIGQAARREAWRTHAALFSYSYYAAAAFAEGANRPALRFLFQLHPHPASVRKILQEEMRLSPRFATSLKWEHEIGAPEEHFASLCSECRLANGWMVASSYTASTLAENGIPRDKIHIVPYGVDFEKYPCRTNAPGKEAPFRVVWLGSMSQRKGLSYFLEAVGAVPQKNFEVLICGHHAVEMEAIKSLGIKSIRVLRGLPTPALVREMQACDLFILPSLAEGFGHALLEAMALGLPVLTTPRTCAPDVMVDGQHGFIVPARDSGALIRTIMWGRSHRAELYRMGLAAAEQARRFTWSRFRAGIVEAYKSMIEQQISQDCEPLR